MTNSRFPTLLNRRARILFDLNRRDLLILGGVYVLLSILKVTGLTLLMCEVAILLVLKLIEKKTQRGFFALLKSKQSLNYEIGGLNEECISHSESAGISVSYD